MIMVDSSVWIDVLRNNPTPQTVLFERLADEQTIGIADLCLFEVLQGIRPGAPFDEVHRHLSTFTILPVGGESIAVDAARNAQIIRKHGFQTTGIDCLLATYCITNSIRFLTSDRDFKPYAEYLLLDLVG